MLFVYNPICFLNFRYVYLLIKDAIQVYKRKSGNSLNPYAVKIRSGTPTQRFPVSIEQCIHDVTGDTECFSIWSCILCECINYVGIFTVPRYLNVAQALSRWLCKPILQRSLGQNKYCYVRNKDVVHLVFFSRLFGFLLVFWIT